MNLTELVPRTSTTIQICRSDSLEGWVTKEASPPMIPLVEFDPMTLKL